MDSTISIDPFWLLGILVRQSGPTVCRSAAASAGSSHSKADDLAREAVSCNGGLGAPTYSLHPGFVAGWLGGCIEPAQLDPFVLYCTGKAHRDLLIRMT